MLLKILPYLSISRGQLQNQNNEVSNPAECSVEEIFCISSQKEDIKLSEHTFKKNSLAFCLQFSILLCTYGCSSVRLPSPGTWKLHFSIQLYKTGRCVLHSSVISPSSRADKISFGTAKKEMMCLKHCSLDTCLYLLPFVLREGR